MKNWQFMLAACVLVLAGCAHFDKDSCRQCAAEGFDPRVVRPPNPLLPNVFVVSNRYLVVDQEPIRLSRRDVGPDGRVTIAWALAAGSPYTFSIKSPTNSRDRDGIEFSPANKERGIDAPPRDLECSRQGSQGKVFQCSFSAQKGGYKYKYTVHVRGGNEPLEALDPDIVGNY